MNLGLADEPRHRPDWLRVKAHTGPKFREVSDIIRRHDLNTVCEQAGCPNIFECFDAGVATFLILGNRCTRRCRFCAVETGLGETIDGGEPRRIAHAVAALGLRYAVITSVTRDDLADGGASHFADTVDAVRRLNKNCVIEVLVPDFGGCDSALRSAAGGMPDVISHNIETVPRLYAAIRPRAVYERSLSLLARAKRMGFKTKSGIMVGLGEITAEVIETLKELRRAGVDQVTIGQYLQPTSNHAAVTRFYSPEEFKVLEKTATAIGFSSVRSGPLVRSSYLAGY